MMNEEEYFYKYNEIFKEVYTYYDNQSQHFLTAFDNFEENCIRHYKIEIYGIPKDTGDIMVDEMTSDPAKAVKVGTIEGYLILAKEMSKRGYDLYALCDETSPDLEYVISALREGEGVLKGNNIDHPLNFFYIDEIEFEKKEFEDELYHDILMELQEIVMTHSNVYPEMLVYYPIPLPYDNRLREMQKAIAAEIAGQTMERKLKMDAIRSDPTIDSDYEDEEKRLIMTPDQINMILGNRVAGDSYPEKAKNRVIWNEYEFAGFTEWLNTRVLYYIDF